MNMLMLERWIDIDGLWIHAVEWSPSSLPARHAAPSAPPLLLVHGLGGNTVNWELVGDALAERLRTRVIAIDLPGFGCTRTEGRAATFDVHRDVIQAVLAEIGPAIVVGNSMGGALTLAVAAAQPDDVVGVVLVDAAVPVSTASLAQLTRTAWFTATSLYSVASPFVRLRRKAFDPEQFVEATLRMTVADIDALDPEIHQRLVALAVDRRSFPESASAYPQSVRSLLWYLTGDVRRDITTITAPTLMVHGRRDRLVPIAFARALLGERPDWTLVELSRCGHAPMLEQPERFVDTIDEWWTTLPATGRDNLRARAARA